jgi:DNA-directed RNA polymerase II subunit RPB1
MIPPKCQQILLEKYTQTNRAQLEEVLVYPEVIPYLEKYSQKTITPGESVGVITGQSIGEKQTQSKLDSFHRTGLSEKKVIAGVPRFSEIIDTTRSEIQSAPTCYIYFRTPVVTLKEAKRIVGHSLVYHTLSEFVLHTNFELENPPKEPWLTVFESVYNVDLNHPHRIVYTLNIELLYELQLSLSDIAQTLESSIDDIQCAFSPLCYGMLYVYIREVAPEEGVRLLPGDSLASVYAEEVVHHTLVTTCVCGIKGISNMFFFKGDNEEWMVETDGTALRSILVLPYVDPFRTYSNDIWEIYDIYGIETTREYLIEELRALMPNIGLSHILLLVDRMTVNGKLRSMTRYTRRDENSSVLSKATFEETLGGLVKASLQGEADSITGVSASIICGKVCSIGTGMIDLKYKF